VIGRSWLKQSAALALLLLQRELCLLKDNRPGSVLQQLKDSSG